MVKVLQTLTCSMMVCERSNRQNNKFYHRVISYYYLTVQAANAKSVICLRVITYLLVIIKDNLLVCLFSFISL